MESETMDEFNTKFGRVVADLPRDIKPSDASILISYIEAFTGVLRYQLRDKEPVDLKTAQDLAEKIERNCNLRESPTFRVTLGETLHTTKKREKPLNQKEREPLKTPCKR